MDRARDAALQRLIDTASTRVPFQRERFRAAGLRPQDLRTISALHRLPPVSKSDLLAADPHDLRDAEAGDRLLLLSTSGSSGNPFGFAVDPFFHSRSDAVRAFVYRRCGFRSGTTLELYAAPGAAQTRDRGVAGFARHIVDYGLDPEVRARAAADIDPDLLYGNRSHLLEMAATLERLGLRLPNVRFVISSSEALGDVDRDRLATFFGAAPCDLYGLAELSTVCFQSAPDSVYTVVEPRVVMEVLVDGRPARPGETGEIVVTSLDNHTMPFIRYATGDLATLAEHGAPSGTAGMLVSRIEGRLVDTIRRRDGSPVTYWALGTSATWSAPVVAGKVRQWQVEQQSDDSVIVRIVPTVRGVIDDPARAHLARRIADALGPPYAVHVEEVDAIEAEPNGKFKAVRVRAPR